jgi:hypothetical protein
VDADHTTQDDTLESTGAESQVDQQHPSLVIAWSSAEPARIGEVAILPAGSERVLGRGEPSTDDPAERLRFFRQRPGVWRATAELGGQSISRRQLVIRSQGERLSIESIGRAQLRVDGRVCQSAEALPGSVIAVGSQLLLLCLLRPSRMPAARSFPPADLGAYGEADAFGLVGESVAAWQIRERAALLARAPGHVLVIGESGTGKEHVARMLHLLSPRAPRPLVSRSAATLPASLIDAELFGTIKNYPNVGMPERAGLIGEAHRSTLFLDEIGELSSELQSHLLRVLDAGEYQRLGSAGVQRADLRLVCATNRPLDTLKHDLLARLTLRLAIPGLDARREDIPLIAKCLLARAAEEAPEVAERFCAGSGVPRIDQPLMERLLVHHYTHHVRELEGLLWQSISESRSDVLELTPSLESRLATGRARDEQPGPDEIRAALARHSGNQSRAFRDLGLKNRYALIRLMKKLGLSAEDNGSEAG